MATLVWKTFTTDVRHMQWRRNHMTAYSALASLIYTSIHVSKCPWRCS